MKQAFRTGEALIVILKGTTENRKIAPKGKAIVQTYSFSMEQFNLANRGGKITAKQFFDASGPVCFDCPFRDYKACYTHKFVQYSGFLSMLRSLGRQYERFEDIPTLAEHPEIEDKIVAMAGDKYIRFGTYGEPILIPGQLIEKMISVCETHTGYTHQWRNTNAQYLMASCHSIEEAKQANAKGYGAFVATLQPVKGLIHCPASKESGKDIQCSKCKLCNGSKRNINIIIH